MDAIRVEKDHYFVLGDNRDNSRDSTEGWRGLHVNNIIGRSWMIWPLSHWGLSTNYSSSVGSGRGSGRRRQATSCSHRNSKERRN